MPFKSKRQGHVFFFPFLSFPFLLSTIRGEPVSRRCHRQALRAPQGLRHRWPRRAKTPVALLPGDYAVPFFVMRSKLGNACPSACHQLVKTSFKAGPKQRELTAKWHPVEGKREWPCIIKSVTYPHVLAKLTSRAIRWPATAFSRYLRACRPDRCQIPMRVRLRRQQGRTRSFPSPLSRSLTGFHSAETGQISRRGGGCRLGSCPTKWGAASARHRPAVLAIPVHPHRRGGAPLCSNTGRPNCTRRI